jgi:hypothetical protein
MFGCCKILFSHWSPTFFLTKILVFFKTDMVKELTGGYKIKYHANGLDKDPIEIDFTPPFRSVRCHFSSMA